MRVTVPGGVSAINSMNPSIEEAKGYWDHAQASQMSKSFCACRKKKGTIESCKVETQELVRTGEFGRGRARR